MPIDQLGRPVEVVPRSDELGWPAWIWLLAALGLGALALLAWVEGRRRRTGEALLPSALFRVPAFSAGNLIQFLFSGAMAGFFFVLAIWLQAGERFGAVAARTRIAPASRTRQQAHLAARQADS